MIRDVRKLEQPIPPAKHGVLWCRADGTPGTTVVTGLPLSTPRFSRTIAPHNNTSIPRGIYAGPPLPQISLLPSFGTTRYILDVAEVDGLDVSVVNRWSSEFHHSTTIASGTYVVPAGIDSGFGERQRWAKAFVKAPFTLPAAGETVEVSVTSTAWMTAGRTLAFWGRAACSGVIDSITDGTTFVFRFNGSFGDAVEGDEIPAATSLGPWTQIDGGATITLTLHGTTSIAVASSAGFAVGDEVLLQSSPAAVAGNMANGYYRVSAIADGTHLTLMQGAWPHAATSLTRTFPATSHCFLARTKARAPGDHDLPYTHVTANLASLPAVGSELTLEVGSTAWMEVGMLLVAYGRFLISGEITAIDDATHVTIERNNHASTSTAGNGDGFWGATVCPYTRTTAPLTFPTVDEETTLAVEDSSWIAAVEVPASVTTRPVWIGRPLQEAQALPCFQIGGRWIAARPPLMRGCLWRFDGATGRVKWKSDWRGIANTGITSLASDGTRIFAGGYRATDDGDEHYTVRAYNVDGSVLWQADLGTTPASVSFLTGVGLLVGHGLQNVSGTNYIFTLLDPATGAVIWRANPAGGHTVGVGGGVAVRFDGDNFCAYTYNSLWRLIAIDDDGNLQTTFGGSGGGDPSKASPVPSSQNYLAATTDYLFVSGGSSARISAAGSTTTLDPSYSGSITAEDETVWITDTAPTPGIKARLAAAALTVAATLASSGDLALMSDGGYACGPKRFESDLDLLWQIYTNDLSPTRVAAFGDDVIVCTNTRITAEGITPEQ